jgi:hypothetical protein
MTGVPRWEPRERSERYKEFVEILHHMLNQDVTTYHGKYYNIQEAVMHPGFITRPHPVFNVAAHGPKALRLAAVYADGWNCLGPMKETTPKQSSDFTRQCYEILCDFADRAGRELVHFERTFLFGWTSDGPFSSMEAFYDTVGRYREAGINDFCFMYTPGIWLWKNQTINNEELLHKIALEAIPTVRNNA